MVAISGVRHTLTILSIPLISPKTSFCDEFGRKLSWQRTAPMHLTVFEWGNEEKRWHVGTKGRESRAGHEGKGGKSIERVSRSRGQLERQRQQGAWWEKRTEIQAWAPPLGYEIPEPTQMDKGVPIRGRWERWLYPRERKIILVVLV